MKLSKKNVVLKPYYYFKFAQNVKKQNITVTFINLNWLKKVNSKIMKKEINNTNKVKLLILAMCKMMPSTA